MSLYASFNGTLTTTIDEVESILTHTSWRYRGPHEIKAVGKSALLRGVTDSQQSKTVSSIQAIAKAAQDIAQAANQSTQLINDAIGGHVLIRREPGGTNEILIMDHEDPAQATKIWRWNMGGLGYSDNVTGADNPDRDYDVAMTMDGAINADFVKTGKLIADVVQIGPETTFEEGYDPLQTNQALKSMADGTYAGGTFIDGTRIVAPEIHAGKVLGLSGTFYDILIGDPSGARMQIVPIKPLEPYLPISGWWDGWSGTIASGHSISDLQRPMYAFDGDIDTHWYHDVNEAGEEGTWIGMDYRLHGVKYCVKRIRIYLSYFYHSLTFQYYDEHNEEWVTTDSDFGLGPLPLEEEGWFEKDVNPDDVFAYRWRLCFGNQNATVYELEFYGVPYEPVFAGFNRGNDRVYEFADKGVTIFGDRLYMDNKKAAVIIDQGSNDNGSYVRWSNGLQVCWGSKAFPGEGWSGSGDKWWLRNQSLTFPATFDSAPVFVGSVRDASVSLRSAKLAKFDVGTSNVTDLSFNGWGTSSNDIALRWLAIGWWK